MRTLLCLGQDNEMKEERWRSIDAKLFCNKRNHRAVIVLVRISLDRQLIIIMRFFLLVAVPAFAASAAASAATNFACCTCSRGQDMGSDLYMFSFLGGQKASCDLQCCKEVRPQFGYALAQSWPMSTCKEAGETATPATCRMLSTSTLKKPDAPPSDAKLHECALSCVKTACTPRKTEKDFDFFSCNWGCGINSDTLKFQDDMDEYCHSCPTGAACDWHSCMDGARATKDCYMSNSTAVSL